MTPLVVAAFAQCLHDWSVSLPTEQARDEAARRFWASLEPFGDAIDHVQVKGALDAILARAPATAREIIDQPREDR